MRPQHLLKRGYTPTHRVVRAALAEVLVPEGEGWIYLLDPCAGTGEALADLADALANRGGRVLTYGVEVDEARARDAARLLRRVERADWRDVEAPDGAFSLVLLNPPYDPAGGGQSPEREIIQTALPKLAEGGVAVLLVPRRLVGWLAGFPLRWLALRPVPDPASPSQMLLVGIWQPGEGPGPLPPEAPWGTPLPEIPVPALEGPPPTLRVRAASLAAIREALAQGPSPADLVAAAGGMGAGRPLHPPAPGHLAALLAHGGRSIVLPSGAVLRAAVRRERREDVAEDDEDREERTVRRVVDRPVLFLWRLDHGGLREIPFEELPALAGEIAAVLQVEARVRVRPDGMPETDPVEAAVLAQVAERLPPLRGRRGLLPAQAVRAVGMARALLDGERAVLAVLEMGFGKTPIALTVAALLAARRRLDLVAVLAPPHLVPKWVREIRTLYPDARIVAPEGDGEDRAAAVRKAVAEAARGQRVFVVLSREAAKLGPRHRPAAVRRRMGRAWVWACPVCGTPIPERADAPASPHGGLAAPPPARVRAWAAAKAAAWEAEAAALERRVEEARDVPWRRKQAWLARAERRRAMAAWARAADDDRPPERLLGRRCPECGLPLAAPEGSPRRWPLAEVLAREVRRMGLRMLLVADEAHEYYRHDSLQARAFARLFGAAWRAVLLTGTLFGGKASELYRLLRAVAPEFARLRMGERMFLRTYGAFEEIEVLEERRRYGRSVRSVRVRELPGVSPAVMAWLLPRAAFGGLREVADALPPYREERMEVPFGGPLPEILRPEAAGAIWREHGRAGLSAWLQAALGYPNAAALPGPHVYDYVARDEDGRPVRTATLCTLPSLEGPLPKEEALIRLVREERAAGRKVVVFVAQTGRRPLGERLAGLLRAAGLRAAFLDAARVPPGRREEWIREQAPRLDALIVHPRAVETGLDLVMFQTAVLYEVVWSAVVVIQAVRRLWRLGQGHPVRVVALAYRGTMEPAAWDLIAQKIAWAVSVYGDVVASGLGAAADPTLDLLGEIARRLAAGLPPTAMAEAGISLAGLPTPIPAPGPAPAPAPAAPPPPLASPFEPARLRQGRLF